MWTTFKRFLVGEGECRQRRCQADPTLSVRLTRYISPALYDEYLIQRAVGGVGRASGRSDGASYLSRSRQACKLNWNRPTVPVLFTNIPTFRHDIVFLRVLLTNLFTRSWYHRYTHAKTVCLAHTRRNYAARRKGCQFSTPPWITRPIYAPLDSRCLRDLMNPLSGFVTSFPVVASYLLLFAPAGRTWAGVEMRGKGIGIIRGGNEIPLLGKSWRAKFNS